MWRNGKWKNPTKIIKRTKFKEQKLAGLGNRSQLLLQARKWKWI